jgi:hypothetical protein
VALARAGHPLAPAAFDALHDYAGPTGQYPEGLLYSNHDAVQPVYDASGLLGDFAARYRPWEGGIVGDAALLWLLGVEPGDAIAVAPHLPGGASFLRADGIAVGGARLAVEARRDGRDLIVSVEAETAARVALEVPVPPGAAVRRVEAPAAWAARILPLGEERIAVEPVDLAAGDALVVTLRLSEAREER